MSMKSFLEEKSVTEFLEYSLKLNGKIFKNTTEFADIMEKLEKMFEYYGFKRVKNDSLKASDGVFIGKDEKGKDLKVELGFERISSRKFQGFFRYSWIFR